MIDGLFQLESKISGIAFQLDVANNSAQFWRKQKAELEEEYKDSTESWDLNHLARIKNHLQKAEDEVMRWQNELIALQSKLDILKVMM